MTWAVLRMASRRMAFVLCSSARPLIRSIGRPSTAASSCCIWTWSSSPHVATSLKVTSTSTSLSGLFVAEHRAEQRQFADLPVLAELRDHVGGDGDLDLGHGRCPIRLNGAPRLYYMRCWAMGVAGAAVLAARRRVTLKGSAIRAPGGLPI